jgi:ABC-type multidrug transport system ATPase subunit
VSKIVPPKREILRDISLSFFPGAKIGVLGLNGSGKSTLLRIMAGVDKEYDGEARPQPGIKIGFLPQEPQLDPTKTVRGNVEDGVAEIKALVDRFNEVSNAFGEPDADFDKLLAEQAELQDKIEAAGAWELERKLEIAADALRLPDWNADVTKLSGGERRRVALCRLLLSNPDMLLLDEPTNHLDAESVAWLERFLHDFQGTVIAVTHDRYFLDNVAGWILELDRGHGIPWEGNYSSWLEQKEKRLEMEEKQETARQKAMKEELEWVRANPKGRQAKSKARLQRFEELSSSEYQARNETREIYIPPGPRLRTGGGIRGRLEGFRRPAADRGSELPSAAGRHRGRDRSQRRRQNHPVPHDGRCRNGRHRQYPRRSDGSARLCRAVPRRHGRQENRLGRNFRRPRYGHGGQVSDAVPRLCGPLQLQRLGSAEAHRRAIGRRTQPSSFGQTAESRRQRAVARRADQRSRRGNPAGA